MPQDCEAGVDHARSQTRRWRVYLCVLGAAVAVVRVTGPMDRGRLAKRMLSVVFDWLVDLQQRRGVLAGQCARGRLTALPSSSRKEEGEH